MCRRRGNQDEVRALKRLFEGHGISCIHLSCRGAFIVEGIRKSLCLIEMPPRDDDVMSGLCEQMFGKQSPGCTVADEDENSGHEGVSFRRLDSSRRIHPSQSAMAQ